MHELGLHIDVVAGVPVVTAPEEIDIANAPRLRSALLAAAGHGRGSLVVDMSHTRFCDAAGVHALVTAHNRAQAEDGAVLLVMPATTVLRVLVLTGVDRLIPNFTSLDEAIECASSAGPDNRQRTDGAPEETELAAGLARPDRAESPAIAHKDGAMPAKA